MNRSVTPSQRSYPGAEPSLARGHAAARQVQLGLIRRVLLGTLVGCVIFCLSAAHVAAQTTDYNRYRPQPGGTVAQPTGNYGTQPSSAYGTQQPPPYVRPQSVAGGSNFPPNQYSPTATDPIPPYSPPVANSGQTYGGQGFQGSYPAGTPGVYQGGPANPTNAPFTTTQSSGVQVNGYNGVPQPPSLAQPGYNSAPAASGYGAPAPYVPNSLQEYQVAPGATGSLDPKAGSYGALAPGVLPPGGIPGEPELDFNTPTPYQPRVREAPIVVYADEARTGRIILGGSVNSDLGVAGQVIVDERNFDWRRFPSSWSELFGGRAFRGGGQNFRAELMPGTNVQRYTLNFTQPHLFGYSRIGFSVGGFLFTRQFRDWTEQRLGGRLALSYDINQSLSLTTELQMQDVEISHPRLAAPELDRVLGSNDLYTARIRLAHDTRDNVFMATEGHLIELIYDQNFGEFDYPRGQINLSRYFLIRERADGGGRHTLATTWKAGITGADTPLFENFFVGGYSTMRGFSFRGASPKTGDLQVGGKTMFLGSVEYLFPLTADDMLRGLFFVDYGAISKDLNIAWDDYKIAPGFGFRVNVPALGPAPLAFDFAFPVKYNDTDDRQVFSFFMGFTR